MKIYIAHSQPRVFNVVEGRGHQGNAYIDYTVEGGICRPAERKHSCENYRHHSLLLQNQAAKSRKPETLVVCSIPGTHFAHVAPPLLAFFAYAYMAHRAYPNPRFTVPTASAFFKPPQPPLASYFPYVVQQQRAPPSSRYGMGNQLCVCTKTGSRNNRLIHRASLSSDNDDAFRVDGRQRLYRFPLTTAIYQC